MKQPLGIGVVGFGWMGQAHSRSYRRIPTLFPERVADPVLIVCADAVEARRRDAVEGFGFRRGDRRLAQGRRAPRGRRRRRHRTEHAPRRDRLGRRGGGQGGVLREARRRHAGSDRGRRAGSSSRRHGSRLQLPLGAARAVHQGARRRRSARADHELPRPVPVVLRQRPARPAVVALPRRPGRPRRQHRPAQPRRRPRPAPRRPDQRRRRLRRDVHPGAPAADHHRQPLRPRRTGRRHRTRSPTRTGSGPWSASPAGRSARSKPPAR